MSDEVATSSKPRRAGSRRQRKPKKNQIPIGLILVVAFVIFGLFLSRQNWTLGFFWMTGLAFGFILQRARFCFTAAMRDPYLTGGTSLTQAVLLALAITTVGFTAIKYGAFVKGLPIPGMGYVVPISLATVFGAFLFGVGMVIAGGCASGTLMRVGEGFIMNMIALVFFVIGSLWGAHDFEFWKYHFISKGHSVFLPDIFGWFGAVVVQLLIIALLYVGALKYEKMKSKD